MPNGKTTGLDFGINFDVNGGNVDDIDQGMFPDETYEKQQMTKETEDNVSDAFLDIMNENINIKTLVDRMNNGDDKNGE